MEMHGYIQDMLDVKVLILYAVRLSMYPLTLQQIYELCFQDDRLSYFDVSVAVPELVESGHLAQDADGCYVITEKGMEHQTLTQDGIVYSLRERVREAVECFNRQSRRDKLLHTQVLRRDAGEYAVTLGLDDEVGRIMTLELSAPTQQQARALEKAFHTRADAVYRVIMQVLLDEEDV